MKRILDEVKTFDVRFNDRDYQKGDLIKFIAVDDKSVETEELDEKYLRILYKIIYVHAGFGMASDYVVIGIKEYVHKKDKTDDNN